MHNIVVIGGNFSGVSIAHYLLHHVVPRLNSSDSEGYKVTLISPSDHTFFKIAAPRALISPDYTEKLFHSIKDGFKDYKPSDFTFVKGEAVALDETAKLITVSDSDTVSSKSIHYDSLVIATGTTSSSPLWTIQGSYSKSKKAFGDIHRRLPAAQSIFIVGGGATGIETAGEIASIYKGKDITLLSGTTHLLPRLNNKNVGKAAENQLQALGVRVIHNLRVKSSTVTTNGKTEVFFNDGTSRIVDIYLDITGGKPNTTFLPTAWLDENHRVATNSITLRTTKAPDGIYSIGDAASYSNGGIMDATFSIPALGYSIWFDLNEIAKHKKGYKAGEGLKEQKYKQITKDMQFVPIGPNGGVGAIFGWRVPSWVVWLVKSRTFFIEEAWKLAVGEKQKKV